MALIFRGETFESFFALVASETCSVDIRPEDVRANYIAEGTGVRVDVATKNGEIAMSQGEAQALVVSWMQKNKIEGGVYLGVSYPDNYLLAETDKMDREAKIIIEGDSPKLSSKVFPRVSDHRYSSSVNPS